MRTNPSRPSPWLQPRPHASARRLGAALLAWAAVSAQAASYTVTNTNATGAGSLPQAVADALADGDVESTITFAPSLDGQTITLTTFSNNLGCVTSDAATCSDGGTLSQQFGPSAFFITGGKTLSIDATVGLAQGVVLQRSSSADDFRLFDVNREASLTLRGLTLSGGVAQGGGGDEGGGALGAGGAIFNRGTLTVERSTFTGNAARGGNAGDGSGYGYGGGGGGMGGALFNDAGSVTLRQVSFSGNSASGGANHYGRGGGGSGHGGALFNYTGQMALNFVTVAGNTVTAGSSSGGAAGSADGTGIYSLGDGNCNAGGNTCTGTTNATLVLNHSIVDAGTGGAVALVIHHINVGTSTSSGATNLVASHSGFAGGITSSAAPNLAALPTALHGGMADVMLPQPGSPAIDADGACSGLTDQRGVARPQGGACDIGAVELRAFVLSATVTGSGSVTATPAPLSGGITDCTATSGTCSASYQAETTPATSVTLTATPGPNHSFTGWGGACSSAAAATTCSVTLDQARNVTASFVPDTYPITATASPAAGGSVDCAASLVAHGSGTTCTASPNAGFTFTGFTGCDSVSGSTCTLSNVQGPKTVQALYTAITSYSGSTVPAAGGTPGAASASFTGGGADCRFDAAETAFVAAPANPPRGKALPQGLFQFKLVGCEEGGTVTMQVTWPEPLSTAMGDYLKHGFATPADMGSSTRSYFAPVGIAVSGHTATFSVTDGGLGDDDWARNGEITDPNGPLRAAAAPAPTPVPGLGPWALALLGLLTALTAALPRRATRGA